MSAYIEAHTEAWHEARNKFVTGTAVAAIMGCSKWGNWETTLKSYQEGRPFTLRRPMWWGQHDEENNIRAFSEALGPAVECTPCNRFYHKGPLGATVDGFVSVDSDASLCEKPLQSSAHSYWQRYLVQPLAYEVGLGNTEGLVEAKLTGEKNLKYWGKEPPLHYWCQAQVQMHVTEMPWCILFARIGSADIRAHLVTPDKEFIDTAVVRAKQFLEELNDEQRTEDTNP